ncbi:MAG: CDP-glycerol glycerophosphotransferase family protein [Candidatus Pacearchaeota archaeon]|jgi:hypothetical protein
MSNKLILIENEDQAREYLKNKEKFKDFKVISFTFPVEKILLENKIEFKTEDDYEDEVDYKNILHPSIEASRKICEFLKLDYKKVALFDLHHSDISMTLSQLKSYLRILKVIIKKDNPEEIIIFESQNFNYFNKEYVSRIIKEIANEKINILSYKPLSKNKNYLLKSIGFLQNKISETKLKLLKKEQDKIFFSGPKYLFDPTFKQLLEDNKVQLFRTHTNLQKGFFINKKYVPFYQFFGIENKDEEEVLKEKIKEIIKKIKEIDFSKKFEFEEELGEIVEEYLIGIAEKKFVKDSFIINEIENLIKKDKITLVLLYNDVAVFEKTLSRMAKIHKIPTIVIQHGMYGNFIGALPVISDYILTYGSESEDWFIKNKTQKNKIKTIGCPRYDSFNVPLIKNNGKTILYIVDACNSNILVPERELTKKRQKEILKSLFRVIKKFPDYKLMIKTRTEWDMNELPKIIAKQENFEGLDIVEGKVDNLRLIDSADIIINHFSTMGLESVIRGKPIICFSFKDLDKFNMYKDSEAINIVYTEKELEDTIKKIIEGKQDKEEKRMKFLKKHFCKLDGKASQRAGEFIENILKHKTR